MKLTQMEYDEAVVALQTLLNFQQGTDLAGFPDHIKEEFKISLGPKNQEIVRKLKHIISVSREQECVRVAGRAVDLINRIENRHLNEELKQ